ncbi:hypothetical protein CRENBAI_015688 [Crenichthys baileyi]|uniref:Uncharacterized protein n=1 Tax=Crenichthys baileyi TaxID=28760 RepID=A0AAV9S4H0_9TELE
MWIVNLSSETTAWFPKHYEKSARKVLNLTHTSKHNRERSFRVRILQKYSMQATQLRLKPLYEKPNAEIFNGFSGKLDFKFRFVTSSLCSECVTWIFHKLTLLCQKLNISGV